MPSKEGCSTGIFRTEPKGVALRWPFMYNTEVGAGGFGPKFGLNTLASITNPNPDHASACKPVEFLLPLEFLR